MSDISTRFKKSIILTPLTSDIEDAENGEIYFNDTTNTLRRYSDGSWGNIDSGTEAAITAEVSRAMAAESAEVTSRNTAITTAINTEISNRNAAITAAVATETSRAMAAESAEVTSRNTAITTAINTEISNRNAAITAAVATETSRAMAAESAEVTSRNTALALKAPLASPTFTGTVSGITATMVGLSNVTNTAQMPASYLDTDTNLAANSDTKIPSQKAIKYYVDNQVGIALRVKMTGNMTIPTQASQGSETKVTGFSFPDIDTNNGWNNANSQYTIPTSGIWRLTAKTIKYTTTTTTGIAILKPFKNNVVLDSDFFRTDTVSVSSGTISTYYFTMANSDLYRFSAGDLIDLRIFHNFGINVYFQSTVLVLERIGS